MKVCWYLYPEEREEIRIMKSESAELRKTRSRLNKKSLTYKTDCGIINNILYQQKMEIKIIRMTGRGRFFKALRHMLHMKVKKNDE